MTRLIVAADAKTDLDDILGYLEREAGAETAVAYSERFTETLERLIQFPRSGAPRPALGDNARVSILLPYLLIYDYLDDDDTLHLLRVLHGKRDITQKLLSRS